MIGRYWSTAVLFSPALDWMWTQTKTSYLSTAGQCLEETWVWLYERGLIHISLMALTQIPSPDIHFTMRKIQIWIHIFGWSPFLWFKQDQILLALLKFNDILLWGFSWSKVLLTLNRGGRIWSIINSKQQIKGNPVILLHKPIWQSLSLNV